MTDLHVSMYMDEASAQAYTTGRPSWLETDWHCDGIDNKLFTGEVVPFAIGSDGEKVALKKYAVSYTHLTLPTIYSV